MKTARTAVTESGVFVAAGYGLRLAVERGHLIVEDGIGPDRRRFRWSRLHPRLRRLIVLGHSGTVTLEAIRWLHDVGVPLVHLDTTGRVLAVAGPGGPDHPTLRRAQAQAADSQLGLLVMRQVLSAKVEGQQTVLRAFTAGQLAIPQLELAKRLRASAWRARAEELQVGRP